VNRATSPLRATLSNLSWLSFGRLCGDAATFVLLVVIARWYGEIGLGQYAFAMGFAIFYAILADLGLYVLFIRETGNVSVSIPEFFGRIFSVSLILSGLSIVLLLITFVLAPLPADTMIFILVIGLYQIIAKLTEGCATAFIVAQQTHISSLLEVASKAVAAGLAALLIVAGVSLPAALWVLPGVTLVQLAAAYGLLARRLGRPPLAWPGRELLPLARRLRTYVPSVLQVPVYARADVIILGFLVGTAGVGIYSAAFRIVYLLIMFANLASLSLFPVAARLYQTAPTDFAALYHGAFRVIVLLGLPAACGLWLIAPRLVVLIFGPEFVESASVLRLLCWLALLFPMRAILSVLLTSSDRQTARAKIEWLGAAIMWAACLLLIPLTGLYGAALAMLLAETVMVGAMLARLPAFLGWPDVGKRLLVSGLGIAAFYAPALAWPELPLALVIGLAVAIYLGVLSLSAEIRATEFRLLWGSLGGASPERRPIVGGRAEGC
jgi:O-antigen/teichoic acid export membrane protein